LVKGSQATTGSSCRSRDLVDDHHRPDRGMSALRQKVPHLEQDCSGLASRTQVTGINQLEQM